GVLDATGRGGVEQGADDHGGAGEAAGLENEVGVGALAGAGGAAEENELLGEAQVFAAEFGLQFGPDGFENDGGILDFEILNFGGRLDLGRGGGFGKTHVKGFLMGFLERDSTLKIRRMAGGREKSFFGGNLGRVDRSDG